MKHDCDNYKELVAASALSALDAEDARRLDTHLAGCADCRSEMIEWEKTAAFMAFAAQPLEPSAPLRERLLARVRVEDQVEAVRSVIRPEVGQIDPKVLPFARPRRDAWASLRSFGTIAAALALVALIASLMLMRQQYRQTQTDLARVSQELRDVQGRLDHDRAVVELLTSPATHMMKLAGTPVAPGAHAMLAYDQNGHAMLMAKGLPTLPRGMAYQLWYIKDNQKLPGKVFTTDAAGNGMLEDRVSTAMLDKAVFAITMEPERGVQVPTGSIYLVSAS